MARWVPARVQYRTSVFSSVGRANSSSSCAVVRARRLGMGGLSKIMIKERICAGIAAVKGRGSTPAVNPERRPKSQRLVPKVLALVAADAALLADRPKNTVAESSDRRWLSS